MAKTKKVKGKGELSDRIRKRKANRKIETAQTVRTNPFEIKINRQKHKVIGKHLTKYDKGIPGISRSKAFKKVSKILRSWLSLSFALKYGNT